MRSIMLFTNMDNPKRHEEIPLYKKYTPAEYPKYENYDAIEFGSVAEIPVDYAGAMGVPITFFDKYNPEQFEIIGATESEGKGFSNGLWLGGTAQAMVNGKRLYKRRSEEHTSELQSLMRISYAVFCLQKKRQNKNKQKTVKTQHLR